MGRLVLFGGHREVRVGVVYFLEAGSWPIDQKGLRTEQVPRLRAIGSGRYGSLSRQIGLGRREPIARLLVRYRRIAYFVCRIEQRPRKDRLCRIQATLCW